MATNTNKFVDIGDISFNLLELSQVSYKVIDNTTTHPAGNSLGQLQVPLKVHTRQLPRWVEPAWQETREVVILQERRSQRLWRTKGNCRQLVVRQVY